MHLFPSSDPLLVSSGQMQADSHVLLLTLKLMTTFNTAQTVVTLNHLQNARHVSPRATVGARQGRGTNSEFWLINGDLRWKTLRFLQTWN